jgi:hypothetical protein
MGGERMEWQIIIHNEDKYIEVITSGIADQDGSLNMAKAITHAMRTNRITRALIDHRHVTSVTGSTVEIYHRPRLFSVIGAIMKIRMAEIIKPEHLEHFKFFETVCVNQGYQVAIFQDREKAITWLLK